MKKNLLSTLALFCTFFLGVHAQTLYDFEGATLTGSSVSNGWSISPTTGYAWGLNSGGTTSGGTGPLVDHTLGTALGQYIYVEATGTYVTGVTTATLTSPAMSVSSFTNPGFAFWYHMFGSGMGTLYIEMDSGSGWNTLDSIVGQQQTAETDSWRYKVINLGSVSGTVDIRFRKVYGSSFAGDVALDDMRLIEMPPYDVELASIIASQNYAQIPIQQFQDKQFDYVLKNAGGNNISGGMVSTTESGTAFSSTTNSLGVITPGNRDTANLTSLFGTTSTGVFNFTSVASITQSDTVPINDTAFYSFETTDSVFARERGNFDGGIGFTGGTGYFGQTFEIVNQDTLTSMSVSLETPTMGDSIRFYIFDFANGFPTTIIDSSDLFVIPSASPNQYTVAFPCDVVLTPGEYFFAVKQINTNNLGFAYSSEYYTPNKLFYSTDLVTWSPFENAGFQVTLAIRLVLGTATGGVFTYDLGPDTAICPSNLVNLTLDASQLAATYAWNTGDTTATIQATSPGTYTVDVTKCNVTKSDTIVVSNLPTTDVDLGNDTSYCEANGINYTINLNAAAGATYTWTGGATGSSYTITNAGTYLVAGTLNNCTVRDTIEVSEVESLVPINLGADFDYCSDSTFSLNLDASNVSNATYMWNDGSTLPSKTITGDGIYSVTVSQTGICNESISDTITVVEQNAPMVALADTFYCTGGSVSLNPGTGYDTYSWSTGDTTESLEVTTSGTYTVTVSTSAGCESTVSSLVSAKAGITVDLGNDINFWAPLTLDAGAGYASYLWNTGATTQTLAVNVTGDYWVEVGSGEGCFASDSIRVTLNLGLSSLTEGEVTIYPNPSSGSLFLKYPGNSENLEVSILSLDGKQMLSRRVTVGNGVNPEINLSGFSTGVYLIKLEKSGESAVQRFILR